MTLVKVLASGSRGNCTVVGLGKAKYLFDAGIGYREIQRGLNFENPQAAFITHEHGDHAKVSTLKELLKRGVDVYMTAGTATALKLEGTHRLHLVESGVRYEIGETTIEAQPTVHDAAEPVMYALGDGEFAYVVDTGEMPKFASPKVLAVEANYSGAELEKATIDSVQKLRIRKNHLAIEKVLEWLEVAKPEEIHLIHISRRHGNAAKFRELVENWVGAGVKVYAH